MRVESWNPNKMDESFENVAIGRIVAAAEVVAAATRSNCNVFSGQYSHPMYQRGKYAGQNWTSRDAGRLKKSIRVTRKKTSGGRAFSRKKSIRVYAGHYMAWYALIVEHYTPYIRPALSQTLSQVKTIIGAS
jgi:hypothetical protein